MLVIYGIPNSQPVRSVIWLCLIKGLPFELRLTSQDRDAKNPEFLRLINPRGTVPAIEDEGFALWECPAIMIYLCEKHGWNDFWPDEPLHRARVNQYLHFHHRNTRELVVQWSRTLWPRVFEVDNPDGDWLRRNTFTGLRDNARVVERALHIVEGMLAHSGFLAGGSVPTLADLFAYEELGQNQAQYANCTDYTASPNIRRWFLELERLPHHDIAHAIWTLIGDARKVEGGMRTIARANKEAARCIGEAVLQMPRTAQLSGI